MSDRPTTRSNTRTRTSTTESEPTTQEQAQVLPKRKTRKDLKAEAQQRVEEQTKDIEQAKDKVAAIEANMQKRQNAPPKPKPKLRTSKMPSTQATTTGQLGGGSLVVDKPTSASIVVRPASVVEPTSEAQASDLEVGRGPKGRKTRDEQTAMRKDIETRRKQHTMENEAALHQKPTKNGNVKANAIQPKTFQLKTISRVSSWTARVPTDARSGLTTESSCPCSVVSTSSRSALTAATSISSSSSKSAASESVQVSVADPNTAQNKVATTPRRFPAFAMMLTLASSRMSEILSEFRTVASKRRQSSNEDLVPTSTQAQATPPENQPVSLKRSLTEALASEDENDETLSKERPYFEESPFVPEDAGDRTITKEAVDPSENQDNNVNSAMDEDIGPKGLEGNEDEEMDQCGPDGGEQDGLQETVTLAASQSELNNGAMDEQSHDQGGDPDDAMEAELEDQSTTLSSRDEAPGMRTSDSLPHTTQTMHAKASTTQVRPQKRTKHTPKPISSTTLPHIQQLSSCRPASHQVASAPASSGAADTVKVNAPIKGKKYCMDDLPPGARNEQKFSGNFIPTVCMYYGAQDADLVWKDDGLAELVKNIWRVVYGYAIPPEYLPAVTVDRLYLWRNNFSSTAVSALLFVFSGSDVTEEEERLALSQQLHTQNAFIYEKFKDGQPFGTFLAIQGFVRVPGLAHVHEPDYVPSGAVALAAAAGKLGNVGGALERTIRAGCSANSEGFAKAKKFIAQANASTKGPKKPKKGKAKRTKGKERQPIGSNASDNDDVAEAQPQVTASETPAAPSPPTPLPFSKDHYGKLVKKFYKYALDMGAERIIEAFTASGEVIQRDDSESEDLDVDDAEGSSDDNFLVLNSSSGAGLCIFYIGFRGDKRTIGDKNILKDAPLANI
ncbi:hypothetical protein CONPUDRAFT_75831 [Coniophora puteana RWD-64-598 SS2]|uniref:Uncharacterized protein n=1 Tax=Coniophora puteana (strain RWD-64-598) TaxID=741705 RepID=A0A5M3MCQ9_CONPW|nr:uncharacterized protein CONPUDRAFT_75831 [Coniophora puteana RWD-64-598 SS2]EIW76998.1 hypothetical protein CONPUDRAFT_75831 [Coniophora puteana RWD-64-598 SS2]